MKQEINDRRDKEGVVATRETMTHTVLVLTLLAMLGVIGFLAAGSVARSAKGLSNARARSIVEMNVCRSIGL